MMNHTHTQNFSGNLKSSVVSLTQNQKLKHDVEKTNSYFFKQFPGLHSTENYSQVIKKPVAPAPKNHNQNYNPSRNPSQINSGLSSTAKPAVTVALVTPASAAQKHQSQHSYSRLSTLSVKVNTDFERALKAIRDGHIFEIRGWANPAVAQYFLKRGWLEKKAKIPHQASLISVSVSSQISSGNSKGPVSPLNPSAQKMLDEPSNFIWACYTNQVDWPNKLDYQFVSRHPQGGFAAKKFLVSSFQNFQWFGNESERAMNSELNFGFGLGFPRSYRLYLDDEKHVFEQDFKLTSCLALLKFFVSVFPSLIENSRTSQSKQRPKPIDSLNSDSNLDLNEDLDLDGILPLVNFALFQVKVYIRARKHEDIDDENDHQLMTQTSISMSTGLDWNSFLQQSFQVTHHKINAKTDESGANNFDRNFDSKAFDDAYANAEEVLKQVEQFWPQFHIDGHRNVWIFKPANGTRGAGIILMDNYAEISEKMLTSDTKTPPWWIVQKYIERPLTIFGTKFDLRQWFLVSSWSPLIAWIYKKSYLRFSGKSYDLDDLDEKIHLTNHSVQQKYQVDESRNSNLPLCNMWSSDQFQEYLAKIGKPKVWKEIIYEGMKKILLSVLLSARDSIAHVPRTFQMQGADFMIADDFCPYLIEINGTPVLSNSTKVTSQLCPQACIDSIRVALDWNPESSKSTTVGDFELFYREPSKLKCSSKPAQDFIIQGLSVSPIETV